MQFWLSFLPIIIYLLLIILLVVGIVLGIKAVTTMTKVEKMVDGVNEKVSSLKFFFDIIDFASDKIALIADNFVGVIANIFSKKIFKKKNKEEKGNEENE